MHVRKNDQPSLLSPTRAFRTDRRGNVAILFALSLVPLLLFVGASIDYTRAAAERTALQAAVDSAGLALALLPPATPLATLQAKGQVYFAANYQGDPATIPTLAVSVNGQQLTVSVQKPVDTSLMKIAGINSTVVGATTQVGFVTVKLEIALALDNSGSMSQNGKLSALKTAVNDLVTTLQQAAPTTDFAKLAIVPFNSQVNIGSAYKAAPWLRFDTAIENPNFHGSSGPPISASWGGCIADRNQSNDASSVPPTDWATNYVAANCEFSGLATAMTLTADHQTILNSVNAMTATGATNITIGVATALAALRPDNPLGAASLPAGVAVRKFAIVLSDGSNTENRFVGTGYDGNPDVPLVEARMRAACASASAQTVQIFTLALMTPDTSGVMRDCASNADNYFNVSDPSLLQPAFNRIAKLIINQSIRLAR